MFKQYLLAGMLGAAGFATAAHAAPMLPDIIVDADDMFQNRYEVCEEEQLGQGCAKLGNTILRFQSSLPNMGPGEFILRYTSVSAGEGFVTVQQEIEDDNGGASTLVDIPGMRMNLDPESPTHGYIIVDDWIAYRIREVLPGDGVGDILRIGQKSAIRLTSSRTYDSSLPNYKPASERILAWPLNGRLGVSVGWTDIYPTFMDEQWVDVTGLPPGEYWLELEVDVADYVQEVNENNNIGRVKITLAHESLPAQSTHRGDTGEFGIIELNELLRVIQFYNSNGLGCAENTEDGFAPNSSDASCQPHSSDYDPEDWRISLSELLRLVQLFNLGAYVPCQDGEDGFCGGP